MTRILVRAIGRGPTLVLALASALAISGGRICWAAAPGAPPSAPLRRVLLIVDRPNDAFAERIRAEIAGMGMPVLTLEPWRTREPIAPLEATARAQRAVAAIRVLPSRKGVEVWMADETSGRSLLRQLIVDESAGGPNEGLIALQTAELLRTSLLPATRRGAPPAAAAPPAPPGAGAPAALSPPATIVASGAPGPAEPAPSRLELQAALGVIVSPGGTGAALQGWLSLHRAFGRRLGLALDLSGPLRAATISGPEGSARVGSALAGLALVVRFASPLPGVWATAGIGAGVARVGADGQAGAPLVARSDSVLTGAGYLRADAGIAATRWLAFGVRAVGGATADRVTVRFAGNDAGGWGRAFFAAFALAELRWP